MALQTPSMQDLLSAGAHFGHKVSRGHPKMKPFIFGARDGVHIIDLAKSEEMLAEAAKAAFNLGKEGKSLLLVGTKKQARPIIEGLAKDVGCFYLTERWVGGFFTNFEVIRKNIEKLLKEKEDKEKGSLQRTKKEQLLITRKLEKFEREMGGVVDMKVLPDAMFLVDAVSDNIAVKEAKSAKVLVIGISDTNADPSFLDYPIAANDDGIKSIKLISDTIIEAYKKGKAESDAIAVKEAEKLKKEEEKLVGVESAVSEEAAVIEEEVEKKILEEQERKV